MQLLTTNMADSRVEANPRSQASLAQTQTELQARKVSLSTLAFPQYFTPLHKAIAAHTGVLLALLSLPAPSPYPSVLCSLSLPLSLFPLNIF